MQSVAPRMQSTHPVYVRSCHWEELSLHYSGVLWSTSFFTGSTDQAAELGIMCVDYADDLVTLVLGGCEGTLRDFIQGTLVEGARWCRIVPSVYQTVGISLAFAGLMAKTKLIYLFSRRPLYPGTILFLGKDIEWSNEVKYLEITLDSKLLWHKKVL